MSHIKWGDAVTSALVDLARGRLFGGDLLDHSGKALIAVRVLVSSFKSLNRSDVCPNTRANIETTIDELIAMLDAVDGDFDLELDADFEPNLGWPHRDPCGTSEGSFDTPDPAQLIA